MPLRKGFVNVRKSAQDFRSSKTPKFWREDSWVQILRPDVFRQKKPRFSKKVRLNEI
jgi:hypothetical protein